MDSQDYLLLLEKNDLSSFEQPPGFDYAKELQDVRNLQVPLEHHFGFRPSIDDQVQDSPHFAALGLARTTDPGARAVIRFSKFGRMVTIICPEELDDEALEWTIEELKRHGYVYIPSSILDLAYVGQIEEVETWMSRFFNYV